MSALAGRPKGRDMLQEKIWSENEKKIIYALMDIFPHSAKIAQLKRKTGLSELTLKKHLENLKEEGIVVECDKLYRLNPSTYRKDEDISFTSDVEDEIPLNKKCGILIVRGKADGVISWRAEGEGRVIASGSDINVASTIPVDIPISRIVFKANRPSKLEWRQIAVFSKKREKSKVNNPFLPLGVSS